jgi:glycosyltransferase-like protein
MHSSPLRIALLTHSVNPRGGVVHCLELAQALHRAGHEVTLMAPAAPGQAFFRQVDCEVSFAQVAAGKPESLAQMVGSRIAAYVAHLRHVLATRSFDIFHAHDGIGGNALADLEDAGLIGGHVRTVHHLDDFADPQVAAWQLRSVRRARRLFCVSRVWCEILRREYGIEAAQVANGVDTARFSTQAQAGDAALAQRLGLRQGGPVFLSVGGVEERKNTLRILAGFLETRAHYPGARLVIAGGASLLDHDAYQREFTRALGAAGLPPDTVILTGPLPDADMPALFRLADALVMPSLREGFGLVVLEAMASGTPAVVSRMAPFTEYLREGECFWADPYDPASIASAMRNAAQPSLARSLALEAAPALCARYSWEASARTHADLYRAALRDLVPNPAKAA